MRVQIVGAGLAGLSAAIALAQKGIPCNLISNQPSERAQSIMAAGGINGALDMMGEHDTCQEHLEDTLRAGAYLGDEAAIRGMVLEAPEIIKKLQGLGVPFNQQNRKLIQRNFGGQKKKRTAYAQSSTGKMIMSALIDACRKYEASGLICRYSHHEFTRLLFGSHNECIGIVAEDTFDQALATPGECIKHLYLYGPVIMACGGLNGLFPGRCTGSTLNDANVAAELFSAGVALSNLEMIQYHPTTISIAGKRCLISEAARGEGGRLFILRDGKPWYFMEELYPELGNLMPRDVVSREMSRVVTLENCDPQVYLDLRGLSKDTWKNKLSDLRDEIMKYLKTDPKTQPVPVAPGIHYFMGGIDVDIKHQTNIQYLYAVGECCSQYHGANRLGGNSMLGAIYGGQVAAQSISDFKDTIEACLKDNTCPDDATCHEESYEVAPSAETELLIGQILSDSLGIVRNESIMKQGLERLELLSQNLLGNAKNRKPPLAKAEAQKLRLAKALILSALERKESRGAHYREDYPDTNELPAHKTFAVCKEGEVVIHVGQ